MIESCNTTSSSELPFEHRKFVAAAGVSCHIDKGWHSICQPFVDRRTNLQFYVGLS